MVLVGRNGDPCGAFLKSPISGKLSCIVDDGIINSVFALPFITNGGKTIGTSNFAAFLEVYVFMLDISSPNPPE